MSEEIFSILSNSNQVQYSIKTKTELTNNCYDAICCSKFCTSWVFSVDNQCYIMEEANNNICKLNAGTAKPFHMASLFQTRIEKIMGITLYSHQDMMLRSGKVIGNTISDVRDVMRLKHRPIYIGPSPVDNCMFIIVYQKGFMQIIPTYFLEEENDLIVNYQQCLNASSIDDIQVSSNIKVTNHQFYGEVELLNIKGFQIFFLKKIEICSIDMFEYEFILTFGNRSIGFMQIEMGNFTTQTAPIDCHFVNAKYMSDDIICCYTDAMNIMLFDREQMRFIVIIDQLSIIPAFIFHTSYPYQNTKCKGILSKLNCTINEFNFISHDGSMYHILLPQNKKEDMIRINSETQINFVHRIVDHPIKFVALCYKSLLIVTHDNNLHIFVEKGIDSSVKLKRNSIEERRTTQNTTSKQSRSRISTKNKITRAKQQENKEVKGEKSNYMAPPKFEVVQLSVAKKNYEANLMNEKIEVQTNYDLSIANKNGDQYTYQINDALYKISEEDAFLSQQKQRSKPKRKRDTSLNIFNSKSVLAINNPKEEAHLAPTRKLTQQFSLPHKKKKNYKKALAKLELELNPLYVNKKDKMKKYAELYKLLSSTERNSYKEFKIPEFDLMSSLVRCTNNANETEMSTSSNKDHNTNEIQLPSIDKYNESKNKYKKLRLLLEQPNKSNADEDVASTELNNSNDESGMDGVLKSLIGDVEINQQNIDNVITTLSRNNKPTINKSIRSISELLSTHENHVVKDIQENSTKKKHTKIMNELKKGRDSKSLSTLNTYGSHIQVPLYQTTSIIPRLPKQA